MKPSHVLMLAHNNRHLTQRAVESVLSQDIPITLCVMNDASTDDTAEYLNSLPEVYAVHMSSSLGVSKLWNLGLSVAFEEHVPYVLVLNNDVELPPHFYRILIESGEAFISGVSVNSREQMLEWSTSKTEHPDYSGFLIHKWIWDRVGAFDESMIIYAQDLDFHIRMHRLGIKAYGMNVPFYHERSSTIKLASNEDRDRIQKQADCDRAVLKAKWGCNAWDASYAAMFDEATFGIDSLGLQHEVSCDTSDKATSDSPSDYRTH